MDFNTFAGMNLNLGKSPGQCMSYRRDWIERQPKSHADPLDAILLESAEQAEGPYEPVKHWSLVTQPLGLKLIRPNKHNSTGSKHRHL